MAGLGLSGNALEAWLEEWMKLISADVSEMAQGGIGRTIPGSRAAELLVECRLARAVTAIAGKCMLLHTTTICYLALSRSKGMITCFIAQASGFDRTAANKHI